MNRRTTPVVLMAIAGLLSACAGPGGVSRLPGYPDVDLSEIPEPVPHPEPPSEYGNPEQYTVFGVTYHTLDSAAGYAATGIASWYGRKFHGQRTSSGETFNMFEYTAAHRTLPLPTYVRVTNLHNGRSVIVRVNDRGPFHENRLIDLSYVAALKLGYVKEGTTRVRVEALAARVPTTPVRTSPAPADAEPHILLQAGAFLQYENAVDLRIRLKRAGFGRVFMQTARVDSRRFYRVRIGPLKAIDLARQIARRIEALGFQTPAVIID